MKQEYITNFPTWALQYVVNGDCTGLSDDEEHMIDQYVEKLRKDLNAKWLDFCSLDEDSSFSWNPEFGLATDCEKVCILYETND